MTDLIQWSKDAHRASGIGSVVTDAGQPVPSHEGYIDTALHIASNAKDHTDEMLAKATKVLRAQKMPGIALDVEKVIAERKERTTSS